jgi:hypothetical protein
VHTALPGAATISIKQTLQLLDNQFASLAKGVAEDRYALWLGSGISFGRLPGLSNLVPKVLEFLRSKISPDPSCRYRAGMESALAFASLTADERARVDLNVRFHDWPDANAITERLITNYSRLLDVEIQGEESDHLLWDGVGVPDTYANVHIAVDVEHLCVAILIMEGAASDIATANWDGLIEKAVGEIALGQPYLAVYVRREDLRQPAQRARLFKFHGCAMLAVQDQPHYRPYLIARKSQIDGYIAQQDQAAVVGQLVSIIVRKPTLMMGLSAQDSNIQSLFAHAEDTSAWSWPSDPPSFVFCEDAIGPDQRGMLKNVYRQDYTMATRDAIANGALLRAYPKPVLLGLVLHVLCAKLCRLIELAPGLLPVGERALLCKSLIQLRDCISSEAQGDLVSFVRKLISHSGRLIGQFRDAESPASSVRYLPVSALPLHLIESDPGLPASGFREGAIAIGILALGLSSGAWTLTDTDITERTAGAMRVESSVSTARIFLVSNSHVELLLRQRGYVTDDEDVVVIFGSDISPPLPRSPVSTLGRTGKVGIRTVSIRTLLETTPTAMELLQSFRQFTAL